MRHLLSISTLAFWLLGAAQTQPTCVFVPYESNLLITEDSISLLKACFPVIEQLFNQEDTYVLIVGWQAVQADGALGQRRADTLRDWSVWRKVARAHPGRIHTVACAFDTAEANRWFSHPTAAQHGIQLVSITTDIHLQRQLARKRADTSKVLSRVYFEHLRWEKDNDRGKVLMPFRLGSTWGYVDTAGQWQLSPQWEDAFPFRYGRAVVKKEGKWGVIAPDGRWIVEAQFDSMEEFQRAFPTSKPIHAYAPCSMGQQLFHLTIWGDTILVDTSSVIHTCGLGWQSRVEPVAQAVSFEQSGMKGLYLVHRDDRLRIDTIPPQFQYIWPSPDRRCVIAFDGIQWHVYDEFAQVMKMSPLDQFQETTDWMYEEAPCWIPIRRNGLWGFLHSKTLAYIPTIYEVVSFFQGGLARVKYRGRWGYINESGDVFWK